MHLSVLALLALPFLVTAADCSPEQALIPYATQTWEVRQAVCGDGACNEQWAMNGNTTSCVMEMELGGGWSITYTVEDSSSVYSSW